ncbi:hypothetical protein BH11GEM1_BH11GEM1_23430 [soil metagenome]
MIELTDIAPDTNVQPAEYQRLLGYPRDFEMADRARELAAQARAWYQLHGRPWLHAREVSRMELEAADTIVLDGRAFTSRRLHDMLRDAGANGAVVVAVSAGAEVEREAQRLWEEEKPDEYFFLEVYGSAVVEHLVMMAGARLCAVADDAGLAVLPHYSPGYPTWDVSEQSQLLSLIDTSRLPACVEVLASGMLRPKKSLLALFGLTPHVDRVRRLSELVPCENCALPDCAYRRTPFVRARFRSEVERMRPDDRARTEPPAAAPLTPGASYSVNVKALRRWTNERMTLVSNADGTTSALFRYEGTTCSNMGRAFEFHYSVTLGPRQEGYIVLEQRCEPAPGDDGHMFMCRYRSGADSLMASIENDKPLLGRPLDQVLALQRNAGGASCYCELSGGAQKWRLALETIHFALAQQETLLRQPPLAKRA